MFEKGKDINTQLECQWSLLEDHYLNNKLVVGHIVEILGKDAIIDINGVRGKIENYMISFTKEGIDLEEAKPLEEHTIQQKFANLKGQEILLRITEIDKQKRHLKFSQPLSKPESTDSHLSDKFKIDSVHYGIVMRINPAFITVNLEEAIGKLPSKDTLSNRSQITDLSTILHIGQEIKVSIRGKYKNVYLLSLIEPK